MSTAAQPKKTVLRWGAIATVLSVTLGLAAGALSARPAFADDSTVSYDSLRTGWDPNESALAPAAVSASDFGQLFATQLDGQIYAQPVVAKGVLLAVTENDKAYGLDAVSGQILWVRDVGPSWPAAAIGCGDLAPNVGVTATPVYDPTTGTAYFTSKVNDGVDVDHPHWYFHAIDITTGVERTGFPSVIAGSPDGDPSNHFNAKTAMQRPGLLLLGGVVYAGFASHCDYQPFVGYVIGVNAKTGIQTAIWSTEVGSSTSEAGIWQSGGGLVSDGAGRIIFTTGNGISPAAGPGNSPPPTLGESVVRLAVGSDGKLSAQDFFSPVNNTNLDTNDADLGAGGPMGIPDGFGTAAHPHLLVQVGKDGRVFLLDRDNLGGTGQAPGGTDSTVQTLGPFNGVWGHPAFWGGDGGYVYTIENAGKLRAFKVGVSGSGLPSLTSVGTSTSSWGYTSGSPVVTSAGATSGSALIWAVHSDGPTGANGQLRAYDAVPTGGVLIQRYSVPIGHAAKFAVPATDSGRVYTGTRDGIVYGFGRPTTVALSGSPTDFGSVAVGATGTTNVTFTATRAVTITAVTTSAPFATGAVTLPATLASGMTFVVPVTFTPATAGATAGAIRLATSAGPLAFDLHGAGTREGLGAVPATLDFGQVPTGATVTLSVNVSNTGTTSAVVQSVTAPTAPFSAGSLPAAGFTIPAGASVSVPISFAPTVVGAASSALVVSANTGSVTVPFRGSGVSGAPLLAISPRDVDFGSVPIGSTVSRTFDVSNIGNLLLTITKAAPPAAPFGVALPIPEGQQLPPAAVIHQTVTFSPTASGAASGVYLITANDGQGAIPVTVHGIGSPSATGSAIPAPSAGGWVANGSAIQSGQDTILTPNTATVAGDIVYPNVVAGVGLHAQFTAQIGGGTGADGMTFAILDATKDNSHSLGATGGAVGYGSLSGVAVVLDTFANQGDPSNNFIGIATGVTGANRESLTYLATMPAPTSLLVGTHTIDVTTTATSLTVILDGGTPLTTTVAVPPRALLAFTASTGFQTDSHTVRSVSITQQPAGPSGGAVGPIVGIAGKCVTVAGGSSANSTRVRLFSCTGAASQTFTVGSDSTLRVLGKCLDVRSAGTANGSVVQLYTCNGTVAQVWVPQANGSLSNPNSSRCLDDNGARTADGTPITLWDCNNGSNQNWVLPHP